MQFVFIIGAGASKEIGMPVGDELKNEIIKILTDVNNIPPIRTIGARRSPIEEKIPVHILAVRDGIREFRHNHYNEDNWKKYNLEEIIKSLERTTSIDNLMYDFSEVPEIQAVGKLAITSAILKAESNCVLGDSYKKREFKDTLEGTWYFSLFSKFIEKAKLDTFIKRLKNICFIIFNYDRTIEQYFYNSIIHFYKTSPEQAAEIVNNMNIYHPYGQTGYLQFQRGTPKNKFGRIHEDDISEISSLIKTFMLDNFGNDDEYKKVCDFLNIRLVRQQVIFTVFHN